MVTVTKSTKEVVLESIDYELHEPLSKLLKEWYDADKSRDAKKAIDKGRKYIYIDSGTSGAFLLSKEDLTIWCIKAYGIRHSEKLVGKLGEVTGQELVEKRFWSLK